VSRSGSALKIKKFDLVFLFETSFKGSTYQVEAMNEEIRNTPTLKKVSPFDQEKLQTIHQLIFSVRKIPPEKLPCCLDSVPRVILQLLCFQKGKAQNFH